MNKRFLSLLLIAGIPLAAALWWPTTISGYVMHGDTGEPVAGTRVGIRGSVFKPWALVAALAHGDATTSSFTRVRTQDNGEFRARILAGFRLDNVTLSFRKPGFVIDPSTEDLAGRVSTDAYAIGGIYSGRIQTEKVQRVQAWPASERVDHGRARFRSAFDGVERRILLGESKWPLFIKMTEAQQSGQITMSARFAGGQIMATERQDETPLVAPNDGYASSAVIEYSCDYLSRVMFLLRDDADKFGWVAVNMRAPCAGREFVGVNFRIGTEPGIRSLVGENEIDPL